MKSEEKTKRYKFHIIMAILIIVYCIGIAPKGLQNDTCIFFDTKNITE